MKVENSSLLLGREEEINGEMFRWLDDSVSNANDGRLGLSSVGDRRP
jgi:hypothetical protein